MINIISRAAASENVRGPQKVAKNLIKGLDRIGYPYVLNRALDSTRRLWIHDDLLAFSELNRTSAAAVLGPNLVVHPGLLPIGVDLSKALFIHPSAWTRPLWGRMGFNGCEIAVWPVGIDTDLAVPATTKPRDLRVLIYHKNRDRAELEAIKEILNRRKMSHETIVYGEYSEEQFLAAVRRSSFVVWHGTQESQGIALQEVLACDVPILVCDVTRLTGVRDWNDCDGYGDIPVSAAPYFDDRCGLKITRIEDFNNALERVTHSLGQYAPRQYVLENLTLERQAEQFVKLWEHWGMTAEQGREESLLNERQWSHSFGPKFRLRMRHVRRKLQHKDSSSMEKAKSQQRGSPERLLVRVGKAIPPVRWTARHVRTLLRYARFVQEFRSFRQMSRDVETPERFPVRWDQRWVFLEDRTASTGFDRHYVYHTAWAARVLAQTRPAYHIDIASSLYFAALVSAFVPIRFYDYRPAALELSGLVSSAGDLMALPFGDSSVQSLSCMHVVEHVGLGRYGDPLDPEGDRKAARELSRVLAPGGDLLFVVPVGVPRLQFNGVRVYSLPQVQSLFPALTLKQFALIPEHESRGALIEDATDEMVAAETYGCGCFWFRKSSG